jgi:hypothetical protein
MAAVAALPPGSPTTRSTSHSARCARGSRHPPQGDFGPSGVDRFTGRQRYGERPLDKAPLVVPLALPGDDVTPQDFKAFWFDGSKGLYLHPNVWHDSVFPATDSGRYFGRQGRVHARVSANFPTEFGCYLGAPLPRESAF